MWQKKSSDSENPDFVMTFSKIIMNNLTDF